MNEAARDTSRDTGVWGGRTDGPTWKPTHRHKPSGTEVRLMDPCCSDTALIAWPSGGVVRVSVWDVEPLPPPKPQVVKAYRCIEPNAMREYLAATEPPQYLDRQVTPLIGIVGYEPVGEPAWAAIDSCQEAGDLIQVFRPVSKGGGA